MVEVTLKARDVQHEIDGELALRHRDAPLSESDPSVGTPTGVCAFVPAVAECQAPAEHRLKLYVVDALMRFPWRLLRDLALQQFHVQPMVLAANG